MSPCRWRVRSDIATTPVSDARAPGQIRPAATWRPAAGGRIIRRESTAIARSGNWTTHGRSGPAWNAIAGLAAEDAAVA